MTRVVRSEKGARIASGLDEERWTRVLNHHSRLVFMIGAAHKEVTDE